jgi:hypothetical protein
MGPKGNGANFGKPRNVVRNWRVKIMNSKIERIGNKNEVTQRYNHILEISGFNKSINLSKYKYFTCLLVNNDKTININEACSFLSKLIADGMVYLCTWGKNCELLHDLTDEILTDPRDKKLFKMQQNENTLIMTTWHNNETLAEALWFTIYNAMPSNNYFDKTKNMITIIINNNKLYNKIKRYLLNVDKLTAVRFNHEMPSKR